MESQDLIKKVSAYFPQLEDLKLVDHGDRYLSSNPWEHSLNVLKKAREIADNPGDYFDKPLLKHITESLSVRIDKNFTGRDLLEWAALLHDIGKPYTRQEKDGKVSFIRHEKVGADIIKKSDIPRSVFSRKTKEKLSFLVKHHLIPIQLFSAQKVSRWKYSDIPDENLFLLSLLLILAVADYSDNKEFSKNAKGFIEFINRLGLEWIVYPKEERELLKIANGAVRELSHWEKKKLLLELKQKLRESFKGQDSTDVPELLKHIDISELLKNLRFLLNHFYFPIYTEAAVILGEIYRHLNRVESLYREIEVHVKNLQNSRGNRGKGTKVSIHFLRHLIAAYGYCAQPEDIKKMVQLLEGRKEEIASLALGVKLQAMEHPDDKRSIEEIEKKINNIPRVDFLTELNLISAEILLGKRESTGDMSFIQTPKREQEWLLFYETKWELYVRDNNLYAVEFGELKRLIEDDLREENIPQIIDFSRRCLALLNSPVKMKNGLGMFLLDKLVTSYFFYKPLEAGCIHGELKKLKFYFVSEFIEILDKGAPFEIERLILELLYIIFDAFADSKSRLSSYFVLSPYLDRRGNEKVKAHALYPALTVNRVRGVNGKDVLREVIYVGANERLLREIDELPLSFDLKALLSKFLHDGAEMGKELEELQKRNLRAGLVVNIKENLDEMYEQAKKFIDTVSREFLDRDLQLYELSENVELPPELHRKLENISAQLERDRKLAEALRDRILKRIRSNISDLKELAVYDDTQRQIADELQKILKDGASIAENLVPPFMRSRESYVNILGRLKEIFASFEDEVSSITAALKAPDPSSLIEYLKKFKHVSKKERKNKHISELIERFQIALLERYELRLLAKHFMGRVGNFLFTLMSNPYVMLTLFVVLPFSIYFVLKEFHLMMSLSIFVTSFNYLLLALLLIWVVKVLKSDITGHIFLPRLFGAIAAIGFIEGHTDEAWDSVLNISFLKMILLGIVLVFLSALIIRGYTRSWKKVGPLLSLAFFYSLVLSVIYYMAWGEHMTSRLTHTAHGPALLERSVSVYLPFLNEMDFIALYMWTILKLFLGVFLYFFLERKKMVGD